MVGFAIFAYRRYRKKSLARQGDKFEPNERVSAARSPAPTGKSKGSMHDFSDSLTYSSLAKSSYPSSPSTRAASTGFLRDDGLTTPASSRPTLFSTGSPDYNWEDNLELEDVDGYQPRVDRAGANSETRSKSAGEVRSRGYADAIHEAGRPSGPRPLPQQPSTPGGWTGVAEIY